MGFSWVFSLSHCALDCLMLLVFAFITSTAHFFTLLSLELPLQILIKAIGWVVDASLMVAFGYSRNFQRAVVVYFGLRVFGKWCGQAVEGFNFYEVVLSEVLALQLYYGYLGGYLFLEWCFSDGRKEVLSWSEGGKKTEMSERLSARKVYLMAAVLLLTLVMLMLMQAYSEETYFMHTFALASLFLIFLAYTGGEYYWHATTPSERWMLQLV